MLAHAVDLGVLAEVHSAKIVVFAKRVQCRQFSSGLIGAVLIPQSAQSQLAGIPAFLSSSSTLRCDLSHMIIRPFQTLDVAL